MAEDHKAESSPEKIMENLHDGDLPPSDSDNKRHAAAAPAPAPSPVSAAAAAVASKINRLFGREKPVHHVLGGGKPADVFLWRDKKVSGVVFGAVTAIWILFELMEYHLLYLACHSVILALAVLFLYSNGSTFINKSPPRIPEVSIPESFAVDVALAIRQGVNEGLFFLRDIASGRDLKKFLIAISGLWVVSIVGGSCNSLTLLYFALVSLFMVPLLYEKHEDKVDAFGERAMVGMKKQYAVFDEKVLAPAMKKIFPGGLPKAKKSH